LKPKDEGATSASLTSSVLSSQFVVTKWNFTPCKNSEEVGDEPVNTDVLPKIYKTWKIDGQVSNFYYKIWLLFFFIFIFFKLLSEVDSL